MPVESKETVIERLAAAAERARIVRERAQAERAAREAAESEPSPSRSGELSPPRLPLRQD